MEEKMTGGEDEANAILKLLAAKGVTPPTPEPEPADDAWVVIGIATGEDYRDDSEKTK